MTAIRTIAAAQQASPARAPASGATAADATQQLYERHQRRILAYCVSRLRDRQDAEDAVQNTFVYAFKLLERGVVPHAELPWLFTIAHNVCRSRRRALWRRGRVETSTDLDALQDVGGAPSSGAADDLVGLSGALAAMPDTQRRALVLREWQGLSYAEIAATLSLSQSAVETLLFRARRNLAKQLATAHDRVAVMLNGFLLVRLARRFVRTGVGTKATAAAVAAGVVAGGGIPLMHDLHRQPSRPTPTTLTGATSPTAAAAATRLLGPEVAPSLPASARVATLGAAMLDATPEPGGAAHTAPGTALTPRRPADTPTGPSVTPPRSDSERPHTALGTPAPTVPLPELPQQPLRHTIKQASSAVSKVVSKTFSQASKTVSQASQILSPPLQQTESTASDAVAQTETTVSDAAAAVVGTVAPTTDTTTTPTATDPVATTDVQQTESDVATTASDASSEVLGHVIHAS